MQPSEALQKSRAIVEAAGFAHEDVSVANFSNYAKTVAYIAQHELSRQQKEGCPWFKDWALTWRKMADEFEQIVRRDPMVLYQPKHKIAEDFHRSTAFIRYFRAGNRTSKTQSSYAEHYFCVTGQNRFRSLPPPPHNTFIIAGLPFKDYAPKVFERKLLSGEPGNPLAPMFPEDGKWFYHYDSRKYMLQLACVECAETGTAQSCPHKELRSTIALFTSENGPKEIEAFSAMIAHGDEDIPEEFFDAMKQRIADQSGSFMMFSATPLTGPDYWGNRRLVEGIIRGPREANKYDPEDPNSPPYAELFQISQFDAGIVPNKRVRANMRDMDEFEISARVYGNPAPLAKNPIFDRHKLSQIKEKCVTPLFGELFTRDVKVEGLEEPIPMPLAEIQKPDDVIFVETAPVGNEQGRNSHPSLNGRLRIWEPPEEGGIYIVAVDTASGLFRGSAGRLADASCAAVLKVIPNTQPAHLVQVAQFHGWIPPLDYAEEVFKLGVFYNSALIGVELTGGFGSAVMHKLRTELFYWNIFRDTLPPEVAVFGQDARFGLETTQKSKPKMISYLQKYIKDGMLHLHCADTVRELVAFEQVMSTKDGRVLLTPRYQGTGGSKDDRVLALAMGTYIAVNSSIAELAVELGDFPDTETEKARKWREIQDQVYTGDIYEEI